jgi:superfamily II DNA or RNA helicase
LPSGARLLKKETERLARLPDPWEGLEFENLLEGINRRLAGDQKRNERLVEHIRKSAECSILFFTNSVQHAEEMSARLNLAGISAAAVSGSTPAVARRHFLDRFQRRGPSCASIAGSACAAFVGAGSGHRFARNITGG